MQWTGLKDFHFSIVAVCPFHILRHPGQALDGFTEMDQFGQGFNRQQRQGRLFLRYLLPANPTTLYRDFAYRLIGYLGSVHQLSCTFLADIAFLFADRQKVFFLGSSPACPDPKGW